MSHFNHVGIGVGDINAAIDFYRLGLGCTVLREACEVSSDGPGGEEACDVLSSRPFKRMLIAHLITRDGIGLELFQLVDPPHERREPALEYWKSGTFHICFTAEDFQATVARIGTLGGRTISKSWPRDRHNPSKRMIYCTDPWGTVIELYSHSFGDMYG